MNKKNSTMEKVGLKDPYTKEVANSKKQAAIVELLKRKPAVYEVCKWEIDPITKKPRKVCWIEEPVNALVLK